MCVFEGFARQNIAEAEMDLKPEISQFLKSRFGLPSTYSEELILSNTLISLFATLVLACVEENGTLVFPMGSDGTYVSAAKFLEAKVKRLPTDAANSFKATSEQIDLFLQGIQKPWLYLSGPTVSPTGAVYSNDEIRAILAVCKKHGARVILDTSYSGLEYNAEASSATWNLEQAILEHPGGCSSSYAILFVGGFSSVLMTGGLEFGFAAVSDTVYVDIFKDVPTVSRPHGTLKYTIKKLLGMMDQEILAKGLEEQKQLLQFRAQRLSKVNGCIFLCIELP